jgi:hypothetical protein
VNLTTHAQSQAATTAVTAASKMSSAFHKAVTELIERGDPCNSVAQWEAQNDPAQTWLQFVLLVLIISFPVSHVASFVLHVSLLLAVYFLLFHLWGKFAVREYPCQLAHPSHTLNRAITRILDDHLAGSFAESMASELKTTLRRHPTWNHVKFVWSSMLMPILNTFLFAV